MSRDDEQVWAELVESFHSSPDDESRQWPAAENVDPEVTDSAPDEAAPPRDSSPPSEHTRPAAPPEPEEHFVPPAPPPIPSTDLITRAAWISVLGVPILLTAIVLLGRSVPSWFGALCAAAFVGGFAILITRLRGHDPYDPDDGAVV